MPNKKRGNHQCGGCFQRFSDRCAQKGHMLQCPSHPDTWHVPGNACVSCKEVQDATARAERNARADRRRAEAEEREAHERIQMGVTDAKKEEKKAKRAEEREREREKRERRLSEARAHAATYKKARKFEKRL